MSLVTCDFRKILDTVPAERTCVGINKTGKEGPRRCTNFLLAASCSRADAILNEMNKSQAASLESIEDLADAMLCTDIHNNEARPDWCQVDELCVKWEAKIEEHKHAAKLDLARKMVIGSMANEEMIEETITGTKQYKRQSTMDAQSFVKTSSPLPRKVLSPLLPPHGRLVDVSRKQVVVEEPLLAKQKTHRKSVSVKGNYLVFPPSQPRETLARTPSPRRPSTVGQPELRTTASRIFSTFRSEGEEVSPKRPSTSQGVPRIATPKLPLHNKLNEILAPKNQFNSPSKSNVTSAKESPSTQTDREAPIPRILTGTGSKQTEAERDSWCLPIQHPGPVLPGSKKLTSRSGRARSATTPGRSPKKSVKRGSGIEPKIPTDHFDFQIRPLKLRDRTQTPSRDDLGCSPTVEGPLPAFDFSLVAQLPEARESVASLIEDSPTLARTQPPFELESSTRKTPLKTSDFERRNIASLTIKVPSRESSKTNLVKSPGLSPFGASKELPATPLPIPPPPPSPYSGTLTPPITPPKASSQPPSRVLLGPSGQFQLPDSPDSLPSATFVPEMPASPLPRSQFSTRTTSIRASSARIALAQNRLSTLLNNLPPLPTKTPSYHDFGYAKVTPSAVRVKSFKLPSRQTGMATPPATPDPMTGTSSSMSGNRQSISRKPIPLRKDSEETINELGADAVVSYSVPESATSDCPSSWSMKAHPSSPTRNPATTIPDWPIREAKDGGSLAPAAFRVAMKQSEASGRDSAAELELLRLRKKMLRQMISMRSRVEQPLHRPPTLAV